MDLELHYCQTLEIANLLCPSVPTQFPVRRLALELSLTASIHFGERSRALSSISRTHPRRHLLIGSLCRGTQRTALWRSLCATLRLPSASIWRMHLRCSSLSRPVRALSCIRRTGLLPRRTDCVLPIQKQLNSQFRPLRVSAEDYGRRRSRAVRAASASMHRDRERMHKCIYMRLHTSHRA